MHTAAQLAYESDCSAVSGKRVALHAQRPLGGPRHLFESGELAFELGGQTGQLTMARPAASGVGARQYVLGALDEPPEAMHALRAGRERGQHRSSPLLPSDSVDVVVVRKVDRCPEAKEQASADCVSVV
jgi:hypothetical protein